MSDNAHCHPSCPCEYLPFSKSLYRSLVLILIYLKENFQEEKKLQNVFLLTALEKMILCHYSVSNVTEIFLTQYCMLLLY